MFVLAFCNQIYKTQNKYKSILYIFYQKKIVKKKSVIMVVRSQYINLERRFRRCSNVFF
jgi:hypothetical protein